jgi:hypothetical protein
LRERLSLRTVVEVDFHVAETGSHGWRDLRLSEASFTLHGPDVGLSMKRDRILGVRLPNPDQFAEDFLPYVRELEEGLREEYS